MNGQNKNNGIAQVAELNELKTHIRAMKTGRIGLLVNVGDAATRKELTERFARLEYEMLTGLGFDNGQTPDQYVAGEIRQIEALAAHFRELLDEAARINNQRREAQGH